VHAEFTDPRDVETKLVFVWDRPTDPPAWSVMKPSTETRIE
jgi:hypothetical protein